MHRGAVEEELERMQFGVNANSQGVGGDEAGSVIVMQLVFFILFFFFFLFPCLLTAAILS